MNVPKRLKTERLILRRLVPEDVQPFFTFISDDESTRYMVFTPEQRTYEGAKGMIDFTVSAYDTEESVFVLAIADQAGNYLGALGAAPTESPEEIEFFYNLLLPQRKPLHHLQLQHLASHLLRPRPQRWRCALRRPNSSCRM